jgi:hypothetical protein
MGHRDERGGLHPPYALHRVQLAERGGVISVVELGGGWVQSDMDPFFGGISQPVPQITDVLIDGTRREDRSSSRFFANPLGVLDLCKGYIDSRRDSSRRRQTHPVCRC